MSGAGPQKHNTVYIGASAGRANGGEAELGRQLRRPVALGDEPERRAVLPRGGEKQRLRCSLGTYSSA